MITSRKMGRILIDHTTATVLRPRRKRRRRMQQLTTLAIVTVTIGLLYFGGRT